MSLPAITVDTTNADARTVLKVMNTGLVTPAEVGSGFTKLAYTPPDPKDTSQPLPCGGLSPAVLFPNALRTGTTVAKGNAAQLQEAVSLFTDSATAVKAFATSVAGLDCSSGKIGDTPVTISASQDVTSDVGGDEATAWSVDIQGDRGVLIGVRSGSLVIGYTFLAAAATDSNTLPDTLELVKKATAKMLALGLG